MGETLRNLLTLAWLLPLVGFLVEIYALCWTHRLSKAPAYLAVGCISAGFVCSAAALLTWGAQTQWAALKDTHHGGDHSAADHADSHATAEGEPSVEQDHPADAASVLPAADGEVHAAVTNGHAAHEEPSASVPTQFGGTYYTLGTFGPLAISLDWYIDSLTLVMFTMVTFIATCIHVFAIGYMHDELTEDYVDHEVHLPDHSHFHRPGRFHRFFAFLSLFCFSMLGLVLAGNIFQVFIFWELVGICSYLLIGFYVERQSASTAANKAFIMNRVGDFGFLIGLMIIWTSLGTFRFYDVPATHSADGHTSKQEVGLFHLIRGDAGDLQVSKDGSSVYLQDGHGGLMKAGDEFRTIPYWLLVAAGLGVFAGCIGKSAQFPLQTWLPDAMEGPTPVSALVHSATMVAAGVYLAGRFYPVFTPEVLLTIAYIGCITLFIGASIALVVTDIKRVLAYSTISQLGYMMLAIGLGGWAAGLFHLVTHAFFKSLMFLSSGSVIAGCHHVQDMERMGGLRRKMPLTAAAMLVGVIAISGLAIPGLKPFGEPIAFSGYHSKDAIVATALAYIKLNSVHGLLFIIPLITAGITAFYMFRLWFLTFSGAPRDAHVYEHAHENPAVMVGPLFVLSILAATCAIGGESGPLFKLLAFSEPVPAGAASGALAPVQIALPTHEQVHAVHDAAGSMALLAAIIGAGLAYALYCRKLLNPADISRQLSGLNDFLLDKWRFDDAYDYLFVRPMRIVGQWCQGFDRHVLDKILNGSASTMVTVSAWDRWFDEKFVDGLVNLVGQVAHSAGRSLRGVQTGQLRQYVMWIAVGVVVLFAALFTALPK
ncbi:MAG: NADH-quinone oxidoreductase subunit L [Planctomycetaceae bacterium]|nr:NADH-quinone oxidoreductase subunit L [Planctomycetaceae bacterium]